MKRFPLIALLAVMMAVTAGCGEQPPAKKPAPSPTTGNATPPPPHPSPPSALTTANQEVGKVVDAVTGIGALRQGRKAQDKLKQIQGDYNRKMDQALEQNQ